MIPLPSSGSRFALIAMLSLAPAFLAKAGRPGHLAAGRGALFQSISGTVADSAGKPIEGAEVSLAELGRRAYSRADGGFRFEDVKEGTWSISVRKIGYLPQQRRVVVDSGGSVLTFRLTPTVAVLPPLVSAATQLGLGGTVVDTSGRPVSRARVRILANGQSVETDSAGAFWVAVPSGSYMVAVSKDGFAQRLASVTIPADSGRRIAVWLRPAVAVPVREAWNIEDLRERLAFVKPSARVFYTRETLEKQQIRDVFDAVQRLSSRFNKKEPISPNCVVVVNGGPAIEVLGSLTTDDVESIEVYAAYPRNTATSQGARFNQRSNTDDAARFNRGSSCLGVYVWLR